MSMTLIRKIAKMLTSAAGALTGGSSFRELEHALAEHAALTTALDETMRIRRERMLAKRDDAE